MGKPLKKIVAFCVCVLLITPVFLMAGCGEEKADYSVFWDNSDSENSYMLHEIEGVINNTDDINPLNTLSLEMSPGEEKTVDFTIWNKHKTPGIKSTFKLTSDSDFISFPNSRIEIVSAEDEHNITVMVGVLVNIRKKPTTSSEILLNTTEQKEYTYISQAPGEEDDKTWIEIELEDGRTGWVRSDMTTITSDFIRNLDDAVNVPVTIKLPEEVEFPVDAEIKITPSKGELQTLTIHITEADWWSVSWVASGSDSLVVNLYENKPKQLEMLVKNNSKEEADFEFEVSNTSITIDAIKPLSVKPGKSESFLIWARLGDVEKKDEDSMVHEEITISAKRLKDENDDSQIEMVQESEEQKTLKLDIVRKKSYLEIVWEETGTDTVTIERYPYEYVKKNVKVINKMDMPIFIGSSRGELAIGETGVLPVLIKSFEPKIYESFDSFVDNSDLKVKEIIKKPKSNIKTSIDWKASKNCIFTQYSRNHLFALVSDDLGNRKLECYDLESGLCLWEYPKKGDPDYDKIIKTLQLKDASTSFDKVFVQYKKNPLELFSDTNENIFCCLDGETGLEDWRTESFHFLSVFGDTDKCLIAGTDNGETYYSHEFCRYYECRKISTGEVVWAECLDFENFSFSNNEYAYFSGHYDPPGGSFYKGVFTADNPPKRVENYLNTSLFDKPLRPVSNDYINNKDHQLNEICTGLNQVIFSIYESFDGYLSRNGLYIINGKCGDEAVWDTGMIVHNAKSGEQVASIFGQPLTGDINILKNQVSKNGLYYSGDTRLYYNTRSEILEMGGYFFKVPSGEYIDLPNTYHLQRYSETTGKYYFLDMDGGMVVCVSLEG